MVVIQVYQHRTKLLVWVKKKANSSELALNHL